MLDKYSNLKEFLNVSQIEKGKQVPSFIDHLFSKINQHIQKGGRILILTLTKRSAEEITNFFVARWYKAYYLHSEIDTIDRWEIIKKLKSWEIDILVWVNLLREGIDLPEVTFIAILDADKEWFLRSTTSLIQIIGRAARNPDSEVVLYADNFTGSIIKALRETWRRRHIQDEFNKKHWIIPEKAISNIKPLEVVKTDENLAFQPQIVKKWKVKKLKKLTKKEKEIMLKKLKEELDKAIANWEFEKAAVLRDQIKALEEWNY